MNSEQHASGFRRVIGDCIDLLELQIQLFSVGSQEARSKATLAAVLGVASALLGASTLTVLLTGLGFLLHEQAQLPIGVSLLVTCGVALVIVALLALIALRLVRTATAALAETKSEFSENLRWIKATILAPETSPRNQFRSDSFPNVSEARGQTYHRASTVS